MFKLTQYRYIFLVATLLVFALSSTALVVLGLKPSIDFTGGTVIEIKSEKCKNTNEGGNCQEQLRKAFEGKNIQVNSVATGESDSYVIKTATIDQSKWQEVLQDLKSKYDDAQELTFETIGPLLGQELLKKTTTAVLLASLLLMLYIGWRFKNRAYGVAAIIAMLHDVFVILGFFALFGKLWGVEVDVMFVTAALTALSFSVHDTIVLFDRIRETTRRNPNFDFYHLIDLAFNSTLVRSLSTTLTIFFVLVSLVMLGGSTIYWFTIALLIGTVSGAYSSPFVAASLLAIWQDLRLKRLKRKSSAS